MSTVRSGNGWRTTLENNGDIAVSVWALTVDASENKAHSDNLVGMRAVEDERWRLEQEFQVQQQREYEQIRARA